MKSKYAYSIKTSRIKETDFPYHGQHLSSTAEVIEFVKCLQDSDVEKMIVLYTDDQNKLICIQVFRGTVNHAVIYPREVLRHGLLVNATGMTLVHNHLSGILTPTDADIRTTREIKEAALELDIVLNDHCIIGEAGKFYSFREGGIL